MVRPWSLASQELGEVFGLTLAPATQALVMGDPDTKVSILPIPVSVLLVLIIPCRTAAKQYDTSYVMYLEYVVLTLQCCP